MKLKVDIDRSDLAKDIKAPIAAATAETMRQGASLLLKRGRANIAAAGFSSKWQAAWKVNVFANEGTLSPAIFGHHTIPFSNVFEKGARIAGKPLLWLPLPNIPKFLGGKRTTPELWVRVVGPLASVRRHSGGKPLLVGKLPGTQENVPLFVGVPAVKIGKRFDLARVGESVSDDLPAIFDNLLKE